MITDDEALARPTETQTAGALLRSYGFDPLDFVIEEDRDPELARVLGLTGTLVTVKRSSTGAQRLYVDDRGSSWTGAFVRDLGAGCFGKGALRAPV